MISTVRDLTPRARFRVRGKEQEPSFFRTMRIGVLVACGVIGVGCPSRAPVEDHPVDTSGTDAGGPSDPGGPGRPDSGIGPSDGGTAPGCAAVAPPAGLCEESWCWEYPAPFGYHVSAVAAGPGDDLWVAGESMIARRSQNVWAMWPAPGTITKLWVSPRGAVFALLPGSGLHRFEGGRWTAELPETRDVSFVDATAAYALRGESIVRWDGTRWTDVYKPATLMTSIWARSGSEVWAASGTVFGHFDGSSWTETAHGFSTLVSTGNGQWSDRPVDLSQLSGSERGDLWASGSCGGVAVRKALGWELIASPTCGWRSQGHWNVMAAAGTRDDAWFAIEKVTYEGARADLSYAFGHWNGTTLDHSLAVQQRIGAMVASGGGIHAVGAFGSVWKQEGQSWTRLMGGAGGVTALAIDDCGRGLAATFVPPYWFWPGPGVFLRNDGTGWVADGPSGYVKSMSARGIDDAWAAAWSGGPLYRRDAQGWSSFADLGDSLFAVSATGPGDAWALGHGLWHIDGKSWSKAPFATDQISMIWARAPDDAWAMRLAERLDVRGLWHWDGAKWNPAAGPATTSAWLTGDSTGPWIAGFDPQDGSLPPVLFHLIEGGWTAIALPATEARSAPQIQVTSAGDVFLFLERSDGRTRTLRWDGLSFSPVSKNGIFASDRAGHLWVGTSNGILRKRQ